MLDTLLDFAREWAPVVAGALVVVLIARILIRYVLRWIEAALARQEVEASAVRFLGSVTKAILWMTVFVAVLALFGVPTTSFIAVLGAFGLAIGLALQDVLANFASGIMILVFKPFVSGEYVEIAGLEGTVKSVEIISSTLTTPDNKRVTLPNGKVTSEPITNYSREGVRRVDLVFGISYDDDLRVAKQILEEIVRADARVLDDPVPSFPVLSLGDSSVDIGARPWVRSEDYWSVLWDLTELVKLTFDERGISIPYPQTDVHLSTEATGVGQTGPHETEGR